MILIPFINSKSVMQGICTLASASVPETAAIPDFPVSALSASASSSSSSTSLGCAPLLDEELITEPRSGTGLPSFSRIWSIAGCKPRPPVALTAPTYLNRQSRLYNQLSYYYAVERATHTIYASRIKTHAQKGIFVTRHDRQRSCGVL